MACCSWTQPSISPTISSTRSPTLSPTASPTASPTLFPTAHPTNNPTSSPTHSPTLVPTSLPTLHPTSLPTHSPTLVPTALPTLSPIAHPTNNPTSSPTHSPTFVPTALPTHLPTSLPTLSPTILPTLNPTSFPTVFPTYLPTASPSTLPTKQAILLSLAPTIVPTVSPVPLNTNAPTTSSSFTQNPSKSNNEMNDDKTNTNDVNINIHNKYIIYGNNNNINNNNYFNNDILSNNDIIQCGCFNINDILYSNSKCYITYMGGKIIKTYNNNTSIKHEYIIDFDHHNCKAYTNKKLTFNELSIPHETFNICINTLNNIELTQCNYNANTISIKTLNNIKHIFTRKKGLKYKILLVTCALVLIIIIIRCIHVLLTYSYKNICIKKYKYKLIKHDSSNISQDESIME